MSRKLWVDELFRRRVRLSDGSSVRLRLLRPDDREKLVRGLEHLSPESRYRRFLAATTTLNDAALRYLTETDNQNHLALVAGTDVDDPAKQEGLGLARFVRVAGSPTVAEPAVTVVDAMQGKGLGRILLAGLTVAAWERGIRTFRAEILAGNEPAHGLFRELDPASSVRREGDVVIVEAALPEIPPRSNWSRPREAPTNALLRLAARGLEFRHREAQARR